MSALPQEVAGTAAEAAATATAACGVAGSSPSRSPAAAPTSSKPKTKKEKRLHWAIRECAGLHGPAVFLNEKDARRLLSNDKSAVYRRFVTMQEANNYIHKKKRKRNAQAIPLADEGSNNLQGFIEKNSEIWEENYQELKNFAATMGDGDPNLVTGKEYKQPKLHSWITAQRREYNRYINGEVNEDRCHYDRKERFYRLLELGVRLGPEDSPTSWRAMAQNWRDFTLEHPTVPLLNNAPDPKVVQLAEWQQTQIDHYIKMVLKEGPHEMYPHRVKQLREWEFPFPKDVRPPKKSLKSFDDRLNEFIAWKAANGSAMVPQALEGLGEWVKEQRKEHRKRAMGKKTSLSDSRLKKLDEAGFVFRCRAPRKSKQNNDESDSAVDDDYEGT